MEIIPFVCDNWDGEPLFIIFGDIVEDQGGPNIYGKAFLLDDVPWVPSLKPTEELCREMAKDNKNQDNRLWVSNDLLEQFMDLLGE